MPYKTKEEHAEYMRRWRQEKKEREPVNLEREPVNPDQLSAAAREKRNAYMRAWRKRNREKDAAYVRDWRARNPEKRRQQDLRYWENKTKEGSDLQ